MRHYSISEINSLQELKGMFPDAKANELNFALFSTSGVHGTYTTLEDIENEADDEEHYITILVIRPRIVEAIYGHIKIDKADIAWLKNLRKSSLDVVSQIGLKP